MVILAVFSSTTTQSWQVFFSAFLIVQDSQPHSTTGKTNAFNILHFVVIVKSLSFHIWFSPVIAALPNANRLKMYPLHEPESSILAPRKTQSRTISTLNVHSSYRVTSRLQPIAGRRILLEGLTLFHVFMGTRLWQYGENQQLFHCLFIPTFARCLSILVESPFLHKGFASSNPRPEAI